MTNNKRATTVSPTDKFNQLNTVFGTRKLAKLLRTRTSHLLAFSADELPLGSRRTERLDVLYGIVGSLSGSFNPLGINHWFDKPRTALGQHSARSLLEAYPWRKSDRPVKHIHRLARELGKVPATQIT